LRQVNDSLLYVVYKVVSEDELSYNMYLFFEKLDPVTEQIKEVTELWWLTGRVLYAAKSLSSNDFKQIVAGTSLEEVVNVDPMTKLYMPQNIEPYTAQKYVEKLEKYVDYTVTPEPVLSFKTYHLLTDGILCIMYTRESGDDQYKVSEVGFNDESEMASINNTGVVALTILPEDFPQ